MPFFSPVYLPENLVQDTSSFETTPEATRLEGFDAARDEALSHSPVHDVFAFSKTKLLDALPGKKLTEEQWKQSEYYREGLSFPGGVSENVAKYKANLIDDERVRQNQLANMAPGFLSGTSRLVGSFIGTMIDPINIAAAVVVPEAVGARALGILGETAMSTRGFTAAKTALGAVEGVGVMLPQALSEYHYETQLGEDPSGYTVLASLGLGAGLGGLVRGYFGWREPITAEAHEQAKKSAVSQMASGKSVHVDEIVQNGAYQARRAEEIPREQFEEIITQLDESIVNADRAIADATTALGKTPEELEPILEQLEPEVRQKYDQLIKAQNEKKILEDTKKDLDLSIQLDAASTPVDEEILANSAKNINSVEGDSIYNIEDERAYTDELKGMPDDALSDMDELRQQINNLPEEHLKQLEPVLKDLDIRESNFTKIADALRKTADCLKGNNG
jgi:hypothetical protein